MPEPTRDVCLAIDTASDVAGIALFEAGELLAETTWRTRQSHSRQLLPALDSLLSLLERTKANIGSIVVCLGPGSYAGMRVGLSTGKALAYALGVPLAGINRLAADALPVAEASRQRVVAVQAAGRAELAYAAYRFAGDALDELIEPGLAPVQGVLGALQSGDIVTGEIERLDDTTRAAIEAKGCRVQATLAPRAVALGRLGLRRLALGEVDDPDTLVPLYLRAPAIGPQPPR
jgi:tRNA threonylcarbamoyladenosine biosynthesis protein TsaB